MKPALPYTDLRDIPVVLTSHELRLILDAVQLKSVLLTQEIHSYHTHRQLKIRLTVQRNALLDVAIKLCGVRDATD